VSRTNGQGRRQRHWEEFSRKWRNIASSPGLVHFAKRDSRREERRLSSIDAVDAAQRDWEERADEHEEDEHIHDRICISHPGAPDCWVHRSNHLMEEYFDD
jgi:hypothetical protein